MRSHTPRALTQQEWSEIAAIEFVRESWGLSVDDAGNELAGSTYGAHFDFMSGGPGYIGDVYVITPDILGSAPLVFIRDKDGQIVDMPSR